MAMPRLRPVGRSFRTSVSLFQTLWNAHTELLRIGIQALPAITERLPSTSSS
ncbi:MAG: hypothetical protein R3D87_14890 [Paracoccaceae bacterium]